MNPSAVLCLETATPVCAVALAIDGLPLLEERLEERGAHAQRLPGMVASMLTRAGITAQELTALVVSAGPGSYTGLRIGASFAKGLLFARGVPFYAANTLAGLAMAVVDPTVRHIHAVIDARRTHVYYQGFEWDGRMLHTKGVPVLREIREVEAVLGQGMKEGQNEGQLEVLCGTGLHRFSPEANALCRGYEADHIRASALYTLYEHTYKRSETRVSDSSLGGFDQAGATTDGYEQGEGRHIALTHAVDHSLIRRCAIEQFEPDYRGNPYQ